MMKPIQVVDLFAGPGGLGEGFSSLRSETTSHRRFRTLVSVEKDTAAHRTLTLRAFYRILQDRSKEMAPYFEYLQGGEHPRDREDVREFWLEAQQEALQLELGGEDGNHALEERLEMCLDHTRDWVLIGGPPCQAYSVVGRARNRGNKDYRPEEDKRHFLYREYLDVIAQHSPAVFVMENVKGILTSRVGKQRIFGQILEDLHDPISAIGRKATDGATDPEERYTIFSLADDGVYYPRSSDDLFSDIPEPLSEEEYLSFVVKAEDYGIPQARHRVILVGVRNDLVHRIEAPALAQQLRMHKTDKMKQPTVKDAIGELVDLRSGLSRGDSDEAWYATIKRVAERVRHELLLHPGGHIDESDLKRMDHLLREVAKPPSERLGRRHEPKALPCPRLRGSELEIWLQGAMPKDCWGLWYNHEARSHMEEDLARYLYCAVFAKVMKRSPIGTKDIHLDYLAPKHVNWKSGKFADRFKVVVEDQPSKTITSHISKDGHYFIHYDPKQCRSLTVREAARLQTFPDDYYFEGNRTEQYVQVGNAVPPLLARQIAEKVVEVLDLAREEMAQAIQA